MSVTRVILTWFGGILMEFSGDFSLQMRRLENAGDAVKFFRQSASSRIFLSRVLSQCQSTKAYPTGTGTQQAIRNRKTEMPTRDPDASAAPGCSRPSHTHGQTNNHRSDYSRRWAWKRRNGLWLEQLFYPRVNIFNGNGGGGGRRRQRRRRQQHERQQAGRRERRKQHNSGSEEGATAARRRRQG